MKVAGLLAGRKADGEGYWRIVIAMQWHERHRLPPRMSDA
jgi:hypothetical protein